MKETLPTRVSICIATYNQQEFIRETVLSAVQQDYPNLQVVVSDDGSDDETPEILRALAQEYGDRLRIILGENNLGISRNGNRALQACDGELIALQGGDDVLLPGKIRAQVNFMQEHPECALSYHEVEVFDSATDRTLYYFSEGQMHEGGPEVVIVHGTFMCATSVMLRRRCLPSGGFDEHIPTAGDWLLWIRILQQSDGRILWMPGVYARYRRHGANVTNRSGKADYSEQWKTLDLLASQGALAGGLRQKRAELAVLSALEEWRVGQVGQVLRSLWREPHPVRLVTALGRVVGRKRLLERKRARHRAR